jgi:hypothetical protein
MRSIGDVTRVIMYLRRQDRMLEAMSSEAIQNWVFDWLDYGRFNDQPHGLRHRRFHYTEIVNDLEHVCGAESLMLRPYIDDLDPPLDVVRDFMSVSGLTDTEPGRSARFVRQIRDWVQSGRNPCSCTKRRLNASIPGRLLCALSHVGCHATVMNATHVVNEWRRLIELATECFPGPSTWLTPSARKYLLAHFAPVNEALCARYPDLRPSLCPDQGSVAWPLPAKEVAITELAETVGECIQAALREEWLAVCAAAGRR